MNEGDLVEKVCELEERVEALENQIKALRKLLGDTTLTVEVPRVILEKRPLDIRISEDELPGRIILLAQEGYFNQGRTVSEVARELMRRCWHPKDLKHVRPAMEQLTAIGILNRKQEKRLRGKGTRWVYTRGTTLIRSG
jgi:hypothetical protein